MAGAEHREPAPVDGDGSPLPDAVSSGAPAPAPKRGAARRRLLGAAVEVVAGAAAMTVGSYLLTAATGPIRIVFVLGGLALALRGLSRTGKALRGQQFDLSLWLSVVWLAFVVALAGAADLLPLGESRSASAALVQPSLARPDLFSAHPLGTDRQGLDLLGGVAYGARVSLTVGVGAVVIGMLVGGMIGVTAGFYRGRVERLVAVVTDSMLAFPPLILLLALVAVLEPSVRNVTVALAVLGIPTYIRLARANTLVFVQREFVLAARALGARDRRIIIRELIPNVALPVFSFGFIMVAVLVVAEASLSFLGLSVQRPDPTWGNMIAAGQADLDRNPHLIFVPGIVLFATVYALNRVGDEARSMWDPRRSSLEGT